MYNNIILNMKVEKKITVAFTTIIIFDYFFSSFFVGNSKSLAIMLALPITIINPMNSKIVPTIINIIDVTKLEKVNASMIKFKSYIDVTKLSPMMLLCIPANSMQTPIIASIIQNTHTIVFTSSFFLAMFTSSFVNSSYIIFN